MLPKGVPHKGCSLCILYILKFVSLMLVLEQSSVRVQQKSGII